MRPSSLQHALRLIVLLLYGAVAGLDQGLHYVLPESACSNCEVCEHHTASAPSIFQQYRLNQLAGEQGQTTLRSGQPTPDCDGECIVCQTLAQMVSVAGAAPAEIYQPQLLKSGQPLSESTTGLLWKHLHDARGPPAALLA